MLFSGKNNPSLAGIALLALKNWEPHFRPRWRELESRWVRLERQIALTLPSPPPSLS